ncbi:MAG: ribosome small subunit-dependent GTPase A [Bacteroidales bacterium]|nr:ribosome small subunit-dependent GTPase A [Bacteroidales bacterium]
MKGQATVVKHTGSHYLLAKLPGWDLFPAVLRGKIRLKGSTATNPVAVGDLVNFEAEVPEGISEQDLTAYVTLENAAVITSVEPRKNYIIRKSTNLSRQSHIIAANLDRAFIIATIDFPEIKLPFLDRILVTCEVYNVPVTIVLNKVDLYRESHAEMLEAFHEIYEGAGYPVMEVSALTGEGIDALREACKGHVSLFSGVSGVGKSSLIKALDPSLDPRVGEISDVHLQGKHTTTFYEMYALSSCHPASSCHPEPDEGSEGFIVDTPGLRGFGLVDLKKEEIALYFPEMLKASEGCRFTPCTHTHEPGCAVKEAVENGEISYERYSSYLGMLDEEGKYR